MKTVLFTGAGASKAIGYPLTGALLPLIRKGLNKGDLFDGFNSEKVDRKAAKDLQTYLSRLLPGYLAAKDEALPLITDVFSLVEHALISEEALPIGGTEDLRRFRDLLKRAVASVLLDVHLEPWNPDDVDDQLQQATLERLVEWAVARMPDLGIVTTNYDIALERKLYDKGCFDSFEEELDLGFEWRDVEKDRVRRRPRKPRLRLFKLHGSLDVLRCPVCEHAYFNPYGTIVHQPFRETIDGDNTCVCNDDIRLELNIVAPSFVRDIRDANLRGTWRNALEWMRRSDRWVFVGYSLPSEDLAIRSLLIRAWATAQKKPEIVVVQPSTSAEVRYRMLFPDCDYRTGGLEGFLRIEG